MDRCRAVERLALCVRVADGPACLHLEYCEVRSLRVDASSSAKVSSTCPCQGENKDVSSSGPRSGSAHRRSLHSHGLGGEGDVACRRRPAVMVSGRARRPAHRAIGRRCHREAHSRLRSRARGSVGGGAGGVGDRSWILFFFARRCRDRGRSRSLARHAIARFSSDGPGRRPTRAIGRIRAHRTRLRR